MSGKTIETTQMGEGGQAFLCRTTGFDTIDTLQTALQTSYGKAAGIIAAVLPKKGDGDEQA